MIKHQPFYILDRSARNALSKPPTKTGTDDNILVDDAMSVCSNISDGTSIYDEVEGIKNQIKKKNSNEK